MRLVSLVVAALLMSCGPSPAPPKPGHIPQYQGGDDKKQSAPSRTGPTADSTTSTLHGAPVPDTNAGNNANSKGKESAADWWARILGVLTLVALAFQVWLMFRQTEWMALSARIAAVIERSHLHTDNLYVRNFAVGQRPEIVFQIINEGRIPAQTIETHVSCAIRAGLPPEPDYFGAKIGAPAVVRPQSNISPRIPFDEMLTEEQFAKVHAGEWWIFVWGKINYTDEFKTDAITGFGNQFFKQDDGTFAPAIFGGLAYNYFAQPSKPKKQQDA